MRPKLSSLILSIVFFLFLGCSSNDDNILYSVAVSNVEPFQIDTSHVSEGVALKTSDNDYLMFFRKDPGIEGDHVGNSGSIIYRRSKDRGMTWGREKILVDNAYDNRNVHGGMVLGSRIVLFFRNYDASNPSLLDQDKQVGLNYTYSDDGGHNWMSPTYIDLNFSAIAGTSKITEVPGLGFIQPFYARDRQEIRLSQDGLNWDTTLKTYDYESDTEINTTEVGLVYLGDGDILGLIRDETPEIGRQNGYYQIVSRDYGVTWSEPLKTNIGEGFFCSAPLIFFSKKHRDIWSFCGDRKGALPAGNAHNDALWIYRNKIEDVIDNPQGYQLFEKINRPEPSSYRLYGYPTYIEKGDDSYLIIFTESSLDTDDSEGANLYQFTIDYTAI